MNFIFFMPDELRAESVGCYGNPVSRTPNFDALAKTGVRFDQCYVQHPVCTQSRCSFMTGWYPHVRGHRTLWHLLRPDEPNLMRYLKQADYQVMWFGKNDLLSPESFADSVTTARTMGKWWFGKNPYPPSDPRFFSFLFEPYSGAEIDHFDYANVQAGIDFLKTKPQEPFLLYLPLVQPHPPYAAPPEWHNLIDPMDLPPLRPANLPDKPEFHQRLRDSRRLNEIDENHFRKLQAVYLGMTAYSDHLLGQVLNTLEDSGLADNTTVVVFSDHGDYAGDYGLVEKWPAAMEDVITRVPLIIRTPQNQAGYVAKEPVELFDIMATTLELAGIKAQHAHFSRSLVPQLQGQPGDSHRAVFTEGGYARHEPHCFEGQPDRDQFILDPNNVYYPKGMVQQEFPDSVGRTVMMRTGNHKLIYRPSGLCELYDLAHDAQELDNLYAKPVYTEIRAGLEKRLLDWLVQTSDVTPFEIDPRKMT
jgi:arylsulfatase A-like enzyme